MILSTMILSKNDSVEIYSRKVADRGPHGPRPRSVIDTHCRTRFPYSGACGFFFAGETQAPRIIGEACPTTRKPSRPGRLFLFDGRQMEK